MIVSTSVGTDTLTTLFITAKPGAMHGMLNERRDNRRRGNVTPLILLQTSLSLLAHLEKQARIDEDNLTLLEMLCKNVVPNLMRKIEKYKREKGNELMLAGLHQTMGLLKPVGHAQCHSSLGEYSLSPLVPATHID